MADPIADAPELRALLEADANLTAEGAPFELVEHDVLGERIPVYARRPSSVRAVLAEAAKHGDRAAYLFDDGTRIGYADVAARVAAVADMLREQRGVSPGDRVAIAGANGPEWILAFWAITAMGASVVALNAWWTGAELQRALEVTEPRLVLADSRRRQRLETSSSARVIALESIGVPKPQGELPTVEIDEDQPALLLFTSGTTGRPKAAVLTHRAVVAYLLQQVYVGTRAAVLARRSKARGAANATKEEHEPVPLPPPRLAVYPLFHVSGLSFMMSTLLSGSPTLWPLGRFDAGKVIALTNEYGIRAWSGSTTHIHRLLDHPDISTVNPRQLRAVGVGGSATTPEIIRKTRERFPDLVGSMGSGYGATETGLISFAPAWMLLAVPNCAGIAIPGVEIEIHDDAGDRVADGIDGNVCVRSHSTMTEYWGNEEATSDTVLPGRWIKLGDVGHLDNGVLYLSARKRDLIIRGGENVYPFEIEHRLAEHPDVVEVAVFGVDHAELGQEVKAVVVLRDGAAFEPAELRAFCGDVLAAYKVPSLIEVRSEPLPRTPTGKVMKHILDGSSASTFIEE